MRGLVIKNTGSWYTVKTDDGRTIESKIKGNFRLKGIRSTNPVAVGDYVQLIINQEGTAFIPKHQLRLSIVFLLVPKPIAFLLFWSSINTTCSMKMKGDTKKPPFICTKA